MVPLRRPKRSLFLGARACARATRRGARALCKGHKQRCKSLMIFETLNHCLAPYYRGFSFNEVQGPHNIWPLHKSEALAPLLVALAHIQVAFAPIYFFRICGPCTSSRGSCTWPLHLEKAPFRPSKW